MRVLALNCGSATLKFDVVESGTGDRLAAGIVDGIGRRAEASLTAGAATLTRGVEIADHAAAFETALALLREAGLLAGVDAVGHRVVHGGATFRAAVRVDGAVVEALATVSDLAPLHNGPALAVIREGQRVLAAELPTVAVFDTAFFSALPAAAAQYALPRELSERYGIRRYGFHGLAHGYMARRLRALRPELAAPRLVTLQLGGGCSAAATRDGAPLDTSMGFTPLEGLVMGTRSGDLDPSLPLFLQREAGLSVEEVEALLNKRSGLLGLSGRSADLRELLAAAAAGEADSALAVEVFCARIRKYVGAYLAVLGGADAVVFGGGIGENSAIVRARVCAGFEWAGLTLDPALNETAVGREARISAAGSPIEAWVIRVEEASVIATEVASLLGGA
jgi:acetate kinase